VRSHLTKGAALVAAIAGVLGIAAGSASADVGAGVCQFVGHADVNQAAVQWVGGGGSFAFTTAGSATGANCVGTGGSHLALGDTLAASGTYQSLACGTSQPLTGNASGGATLKTPGGASDGTGSFSIPFVGGQGLITGSFAATGGQLGTGAGPLAGFVTIFPSNPLTTAVTGGGNNAAQNPTPIDFSSTPLHPVTSVVFAGGDGPGSLSSTCVSTYGVAGAFAYVSTA
jgi:hypothetical protein